VHRESREQRSLAWASEIMSAISDRVGPAAGCTRATHGTIRIASRRSSSAASPSSGEPGATADCLGISWTGASGVYPGRLEAEGAE
jgi:hypothetical protein